MSSQQVRIHATQFRSRANGPGSRTVVWFQGCSLACPGCFNPDTHISLNPDSSTDELLKHLLEQESNPDGLTISGGEPLEQPTALRELVERWKEETKAGVIVLTGFTWKEIQSDTVKVQAVARADLVITGRYNSQLHIATGLRGSQNKNYNFLTNVYSLQEMLDVPELEVLIEADGVVHVTGVAGSEALTQSLISESQVL